MLVLVLLISKARVEYWCLRAYCSCIEIAATSLPPVAAATAATAALGTSQKEMAMVWQRNEELRL
eukprot:gene13643-14459_t